MTITDHDMRTAVIETLAGTAGDYDIRGIVDEIQRVYGTVDIDAVPSEAYWEIVARHDFTA